MKIKIELDDNETIEQAHEALEKAINIKKLTHDHEDEERYADEYLNEFEAYLIEHHKNVLDTVIKRLQQALIDDIRGNS